MEERGGGGEGRGMGWGGGAQIGNGTFDRVYKVKLGAPAVIAM